jgi:hypothetical protein
MADVFISYSRVDRERVRRIVDRLVAAGYSIWWDVELQAGDQFAFEIERQVESAKVVFTAWSNTARDSTWVYAETARGLDARKQVQARLDGVHPPLPFDALQIADLSGGGRNADENWRFLEGAVRRIVREGGQPDPPAHTPGFLATPEAAGNPKLISFINALGLFITALALQKANAGALDLDYMQYAMGGVFAFSLASALMTLQRMLAIARAGG